MGAAPASLAHLHPTLLRARSVSPGTACGKLLSLIRADLNALGDLPVAQGIERGAADACRWGGAAR